MRWRGEESSGWVSGWSSRGWSHISRRSAEALRASTDCSFVRERFLCTPQLPATPTPSRPNTSATTTAVRVTRVIFTPPSPSFSPSRTLLLCRRKETCSVEVPLLRNIIVTRINIQWKAQKQQQEEEEELEEAGSRMAVHYRYRVLHQDGIAVWRVDGKIPLDLRSCSSQERRTYLDQPIHYAVPR